MTTQRFEHRDQNTGRFWEITQRGNAVTTRHGTGAETHTTERQFGSEQEARQAYDRLVAEKGGAIFPGKEAWENLNVFSQTLHSKIVTSHTTQLTQDTSGKAKRVVRVIGAVLMVLSLGFLYLAVETWRGNVLWVGSGGRRGGGNFYFKGTDSFAEKTQGWSPEEIERWLELSQKNFFIPLIFTAMLAVMGGILWSVKVTHYRRS